MNKEEELKLEVFTLLVACSMQSLTTSMFLCISSINIVCSTRLISLVEED